MSDDRLPDAEDRSIDDLARRAGAAVRRPAPEGLTDRVRAARRRQQTVRSAAAIGATLVVVAVVATVSLSGDDRTVTPAVTTSTSAPASTTSAPGTTTSLADTTTSTPDTTTPVVLPSLPPIGWDADGVPDALYSIRSDGGFDVVDPNTFQVTGTVAQLDTSPVPVILRSRSGTVQYGFPDRSDPLDIDDCGQSQVSDFVTGADLTGLPQRFSFTALSADGSTVAFSSAVCPEGNTFDENGRPTATFDVVVLVADADEPSVAPRELFRFNTTHETDRGVELSSDGSFLKVRTKDASSGEGPIGTHDRVFDTRTGRLVGALGTDGPALPHTDCLDFSPRFIGTTALGYTALCPEGVRVVIRDLATGEGIDVLQPEFAGRTYETLVSMSLEVDRGTYRSPTASWYLLCGGRSVRQGNGAALDPPGSFPCFLGHGDAPMVEVPVAGSYLTFPPPS